MNERLKPDPELARVLAEAGETGVLLDWMEGEARELHRAALDVLADPDADPVDRERARRIRDHLDQTLAELRELADVDGEEAW